MDYTSTDITREERQNAVISYCFLGIFILLSRQERFQSHFVNQHAKVASLIQFLFLGLIITSIYSQNFWSMLIFDFSLSNIVYFFAFMVLFGLLGIGTVQAIQGKYPRITLSGKGFKDLMHTLRTTNTLEDAEKIPTILSHIPVIGNLIANKYGAAFYSGERFATWALIMIIFFLMIDSSMVLAIVCIFCLSVWIIYQSISLVIDNSLILLGNYLPTSKHVHIFLTTLTKYSLALLSHSQKTLPHWRDIYQQNSEKYEEKHNMNLQPIMSIPVINMVFILKNRHTLDMQLENIQGIFLTVGCLVSILLQMYSVTFLILYVGYLGFLSLHYRHVLRIPVLLECAQVTLRCIHWVQKISKKRTQTFVS